MNMNSEPNPEQRLRRLEELSQTWNRINSDLVMAEASKHPTAELEEQLNLVSREIISLDPHLDDVTRQRILNEMEIEKLRKALADE